jgi:hypothetical protein
MRDHRFEEASGPESRPQDPPGNRSAEEFRAIVSREEAVLVLHGVAVGNMGHVVKERDRADDRLLPSVQIPAAPGIPGVIGPDGVDQSSRDVISAQGMLEAGVLRAGVHVERGAQLADVPEALHLRGIEEREIFT